MPRKRWVRYVLLGLVFVAAGVVIVSSNPIIGWACIAFFGFGTLVLAMQLVRPSVLVLDGSGFSTRVLLQQRPRERMWRDCGPFSEWTEYRTELVMFTVTRRGGLSDKSIQAGYGGLNAHDLAALMNRYRAASGGHDGL